MRGGDRGVGTHDVEVAKRAEARCNEALAERDGQAGDCENDHEGHLEAGLEERAGVENEHGERGCA